MTLRKLITPGVNPGGVDKLYGEDWNRLVDALTGGVAENITVRGALIRSGANPLVEVLGDDSDSFAGIRFRGRDTWDVLAMATSGAPSGGLKFRDADTGATISFDRNANVGIPSTKRLYLDGDANGVGQDTWIEENSANSVRFRSGATGTALEDRFSFQKTNAQLTTLQVLLGDGTSGLQATLGNGTAAQSFVIRAWDGSAHVERIRLDSNGHVIIPAAKRLYLDGSGGAGGDTYVYESSNNVVKIVAGAVESFVVRDDYVQSNLNFIVNSAKKLYLDGGGDSYLWEQSTDAVELVAGGAVSAKFQSTIFMGLVKSYTADPTTANISPGYFAVWKNTTANEIRVWVNDGGTMKKSAALT